MTFRFDSEDLENGLDELFNRAEEALQLYGDTAAQKMEDKAKENALWVDRSGRARGALRGRCIKSPRGYRIALSQGVEYGVWLELAHEKRYAILMPTINAMSPEVIRGLKTLINRMR